MFTVRSSLLKLLKNSIKFTENKKNKKFHCARIVIIAKTHWSMKSPWTERNVDKSQSFNCWHQTLRIFTIDQDVRSSIWDRTRYAQLYSFFFFYYYTKTMLIKRNVFKSCPYRWRYTITDYRRGYRLYRGDFSMLVLQKSSDRMPWPPSKSKNSFQSIIPKADSPKLTPIRHREQTCQNGFRPLIVMEDFSFFTKGLPYRGAIRIIYIKESENKLIAFR